jgi:phage repressor protein C with HTH and peptisase S24 domain
MLKHGDIWRAIDRLAEEHGFTPSGLARQAGLDSTAFNRSKRQTPEGRPRWPSTESIAKILAATGADMGAFAALIEDAPGPASRRRIPIIGYAQAGEQGFFDDAGYPVGSGWDEVVFPAVGDPHAYALEVSGDSMEPVWRDGAVIVVSPSTAVRRGDRVVVRTTEGEVLAKALARLTVQRVELRSFNPMHPDRSLRRSEVEWMARILWASQ